MRTIPILAATATAATLLIALPAQASAPRPYLHGQLNRVVTTPCPTEDSVNCYWDARVRGDGRGRSFYTITIDRARVLRVYVDGRGNRVVPR